MTTFMNNVKIYDEDGDVKLVHYIPSKDGKTDYEFLRGIVINTDLDSPLEIFSKFYEQPDTQKVKVVGRSFSLPLEIVDEDEITDLLPKDLTGLHISESYEGTVVRAFYTNDKWYFSTHRKLNMFMSKWSGKSFGHIFLDCLKSEVNNNVVFISECPDLVKTQDISTFSSYLNKDNCYVFLLVNHPQNRIACDGIPRLFHIGTFAQAPGTWMVPVDDFIGLSKPSTIDGITTVQDLITRVKEMNPKIHQGLLVNLSNDKQVKILNKDYSDMIEIRGNDPDIIRRYLQIRQEPEKVAFLEFLFPGEKEKINDVETDLNMIVKTLHKLYLIRHVYNGGMFLRVPKEDHIILEKCHEWHISNRAENKVKQTKIREVLNETEYYYVYKILKRYRSPDSPYPVLLRQY